MTVLNFARTHSSAGHRIGNSHSQLHEWTSKNSNFVALFVSWKVCTVMIIQKTLSHPFFSEAHQCPSVLVLHMENTQWRVNFEMTNNWGHPFRGYGYAQDPHRPVAPFGLSSLQVARPYAIIELNFPWIIQPKFAWIYCTKLHFSHRKGKYSMIRQIQWAK